MVIFLTTQDPLINSKIQDNLNKTGSLSGIAKFVNMSSHGLRNNRYLISKLEIKY